MDETGLLNTENFQILVENSPLTSAGLTESSFAEDSFHERIPLRFRRLDELGKGQYATVYRAEDLEDSKKIVAIKHLRLLTDSERSHLSGTSNDLREAEILASLAHPNIIRLISSFNEGPQKTLIMECMDFSLEDVISDKRSLPEFLLSHIMYYLLHIAHGLTYLHKENVVHRDLKPNNVLLNLKGDVKIADFGCSKRYCHSDPRYTKQRGSRTYLPPEALLCSSVVNETVDLWALGCISAEFYRRKPLFGVEGEGSDLAQLTRIHSILGSPDSEDYPEGQVKGIDVSKFHRYPKLSPKEVLPRAHDIVHKVMEKCLVYDVSKRWTSDACLTYLLQLDGDGTGLQIPDPWPVPRTARMRESLVIPPVKRRSEHMNPLESSSTLDLSINEEEEESHSPSKKARVSGNFQEKLCHSKVRRKLF